MSDKRHGPAITSELTFGEWLKRRRRGLGLTQEELAEQLGYSTVMIRKLEGDVARPSRALAEALAARLEIPSAEQAAFIKFAREGIVAAPVPLPPVPSPPPVPAPSVPSLPLPLTRFIGRDHELAQIRQLLYTTRLLTLTGIGGSGKTRLALQAATDLAATFGHGVYLVELAPIARPDLVPAVIAAALGVRETPDRSLLDELAAHLRPQEALLVLDNCEHLAAACAQVVHRLLRACPHLQLLATSQVALNIEGETVFPVPPLSVPAGRDVPPLEELQFSEAVSLFVERAQAVQAGFELTAHSAASVVEICRRLDGLPLAIELAAARVRLMSVEEIAARLDDMLRLLTRGQQGATARHATLRATMAWSYALLTEGEAGLLRRAAVFADGFTLAAAEAVCAEEEHGAALTPDSLLDALAALVDKSWLVPQTGAGETRYRLLEPVRHYALEKLAEAGETARVQDRLVDWSVALAEQAEPALRGPDQGRWLTRLAAEYDNLRAVLRITLEHDLTRGGRLAGALARFWYIRGEAGEGQLWLEALLAQPGLAGTARAHALRGAGMMAFLRGDYALARARCEESLALYRPLGVSPGLAHSLNNLAGIVLNQGELAQARALYDESLALYRSLGDTWGVALTVNNLASLAYQQGEYAAAESLFRESLAQARAMGDQQSLARALGNLGLLARQRGDRAAARSFYLEGLALRRELGDRLGVAAALHQLGTLAADEGDAEQARSLFEQALAIRQAAGDKRAVAYSLAGLARLALDQGDYGLARRHYQTGLTTFYSLGERWGSLMGLTELGWVASGAGRPEVGARLLGAADAWRARLGVAAPPSDQTRQAEVVAALRQTLGETEFAAQWAAGQALSLDQAVQLGLTFE